MKAFMSLNDQYLYTMGLSNKIVITERNSILFGLTFPNTLLTSLPGLRVVMAEDGREDLLPLRRGQGDAPVIETNKIWLKT